jgi:hypothetical protein
MPRRRTDRLPRAASASAVGQVRGLVGEAVAVVLYDVLVLVDADNDLAPEVPAALRAAHLERGVDAPPDLATRSSSPR